MSNQQHPDYLDMISKYATIIAALVAIVTLPYIVSTLYYTRQQASESQEASEILQELQKTNKLLLASLYSDFELEATYEINPLKTEYGHGGLQYDMRMIYTGKYDALVTSEWYVTKACDENNVLLFFDRLDAIANASRESHEFFASEIDPPDKIYLLQLHDIYSNYTNHQPFEMELVVLAEPISPNGEVIEFSIPKKKIARIQFFYDAESKNWIPNATWEELNCHGNPRVGSSSIKIDTTNQEQFHSL